MADPRLGNFQSCCRLCLCENADTLKSIFDETIEDGMLPQKILQFVAIEISKSDKMSTMICVPCITKVNGWQEYKKECAYNQRKLEEWVNSCAGNSLADISLQIKEEPVNDADETSCDRPENEIAEVLVKNEPIDPPDEPMEEEYNELPPPLTPHPPPGTDSENSQESTAQGSVNNRQCTICNKLFSSTGNRKKHEKQIHGVPHSSNGDISHKRSQMNEVPVTVNIADPLEDFQRVPIEEQAPEPPTPEQMKIQFAAGLKLLQKNSTPISCEPLSKIELSYMEKCKAMVNMHRSLECACHNVAHPNLKGLLSHLRALRIWFPVFTCYNCMITFTDRSTFTRHSVRCPKSSLETIIKLSNLKKRSEVKTRLYQNFKCTSCKFMYSFHDDFCKHVDEEHSEFEPPVTCSCTRVFDNVDDYKDHIYVTCMVEYYCDICFITTRTLEAFQKHANEVHDNSEGFILLQDDNYKMRKSLISKPEVTDENVIVTGKRERRMSIKAPIIEPDDDEPPRKKIHPAILASGSKICPLCSKEYSNHKNMIRHYKSHLDTPIKTEPEINDDSFYSCPDCGGMYTTVDWRRHLAEQHEPITCGECGKIFQFKTELDQHRSVHLNLKVYRDSKTQSYKTSMVSPGSEGEVMLMCEICEHMFTNKEDLKQHKLLHENGVSAVEPEPEVKESRYACKPCNKVYSSYGGIWDHNKKKHPEKKSPYVDDFPKQCLLCDKVCATGAAYFRHKQIHEKERINANNAAVTQAKVDILNENDDEEEESYHTCKRCFKVFSSRYNLKNHMKSHGISPTSKKIVKKVWCEICHQSFLSNEALEKHKEEHNAEELSQYSNSTDGKVIFTCSICVMTFSTQMALKKHKEKHVLEGKSNAQKGSQIYCKYCKIAFESVVQLTKHMHVEHGETAKPRITKEKPRTFSCTVCKKSFLTSAALSTHMGWHKRTPSTGGDGKPAKILKQNKIIAKLASVKQEPIDPPEYQCTTCLAEFPNDTALQVHILEKHRSVSAIMLVPRCNTCNKDFNTQQEYDNHKLFHDFLERQKQHEQQESGEQPSDVKPSASSPKFTKAFPCKYCNAAFSRADTLNSHVRQYHKDFVQNEFKCTQCDRVFDKQNSLTIHLKVHEKQKTSTTTTSTKSMFACSICSMGFDVPKDLRAHTISAHPF